MDQGSSHSVTTSHRATSSDSHYNGIAIRNVTAMVTDNDRAAVTITESSGFTLVSEVPGGRTDTYTVTLNTVPTGDVTIAVESGDTGAVTVSPATLTFTAANWSTGQTVTITVDAQYSTISIPSVTATVAGGGSTGPRTASSGVQRCCLQWRRGPRLWHSQRGPQGHPRFHWDHPGLLPCERHSHCQQRISPPSPVRYPSRVGREPFPSPSWRIRWLMTVRPSCSP